jgi:hypothetical protein
MEVRMLVLRSALALFGIVTALAAVIGTTLIGGSWDPYFVWHAQSVTVATAPTYSLLAIGAWRGRHRPLLDGVILIALIGFVACAIWFARMWLGPFPDELTAAQSRSWAGLAWTYCLLALASIIPAPLISYFALRRTPLLRGLVPQKVDAKTKGPAEASP